jgi:hypothetical protein
MAHEETDFFDEIERELVALTTAGLVEGKPHRARASSFTYTLDTVIRSHCSERLPAKAGTHTTHDFTTKNDVTTMQRCYGFPPARE